MRTPDSPRSCAICNAWGDHHTDRHPYDEDMDCPRCERTVDVLDLCECDHELGPFCGPCCRIAHRPGDAA